jgi:trehalose 6-phosphate synthase
MAGIAVDAMPTRSSTGGPNSGRDTHRRPQLLVVSNRGPVSFDARRGNRIIERNGGGLVTALRDVMRHVEGTRFVCSASSDEDREVAREGWREVELGDARCEVRMLALDPRVQHDFYAVIANPLLWFIQHYLWCHGTAPDIGARELDAWDNGYVKVNEQFVKAIVGEHDAPEGSVVMVHDYHFYLVPELLRRARPDLFVHFFVHIPWPHPDSWRILPRRMREQIFRGLLGSDIVAFHTHRYCRNFLLGCEELLGLEVDLRRSSVRIGDRVVAVRFYPISVDETPLREVAGTDEVAAYEAELARTRPDKLIVRVDRTDPSKNVVRGFRAFDRMLELHPWLEGRVTFLALLQPSRQDVPEYAQHLRAIEASVAEINDRRGRPGWTPIDLRLGDNLPLAVAAYKRFDVLMVNAVYDGMNLVSKEALVLNESDGVLALSENTGAHEELGAIAVSLQPFDIEQQAAALFEALTMPAEQRRERHEVGVDIVRTNNMHKWLYRQLFDIELMRGKQLSLGGLSEPDRLASQVHV